MTMITSIHRMERNQMEVKTMMMVATVFRHLLMLMAVVAVAAVETTITMVTVMEEELTPED